MAEHLSHVLGEGAERGGIIGIAIPHGNSKGNRGLWREPDVFVNAITRNQD
jgi:hypothetical protein